MDVPTRCAQPTVRGISTYTVLGFAGYGAANILGIVLARAWDFTLADRLVTFLAPPIAFIVVVFAARLILREERIVFYQTAVASVAAVVLVGFVAGAHVERCLDVAVIGIGTFLVFGRMGCFSVACCHGRPARWGVVYGPRHVRAGFWARWSGRRLWPVQLVEAFASGLLVILALVLGWDHPGEPTVIYAVGYGVCRFLLEIVRGDATRPHAYGLSEAQLTTPAILTACAFCRPGIVTIAAAIAIAVIATVISRLRPRRELVAAPHLREIDRACASLVDGTCAETSRGLMISCHKLPDGRSDWVMSSTHPAWSESAANRIAGMLWHQHEVVAGRTPGVIHVLTP